MPKVRNTEDELETRGTRVTEWVARGASSPLIDCVLSSCDGSAVSIQMLASA